jgi:hypothetical protein
MTHPSSYTCPVCGDTGYHPRDVEQGYCGQCQDWTGDYLSDPSERVQQGDNIYAQTPEQAEAVNRFIETGK